MQNVGPAVLLYVPCTNVCDREFAVCAKCLHCELFVWLYMSFPELPYSSFSTPDSSQDIRFCYYETLIIDYTSLYIDALYSCSIPA